MAVRHALEHVFEVGVGLDPVELCRGEKRGDDGPSIRAVVRLGPDFWSRIQDRVVAGDIPEDWTFDTLIIDEGQDFQAEWVEILHLFVRGEPDILWLEDQDQGIRGESPVELDGFVGYRASANFRSPESIARFIQKVVPFQFEMAGRE